MPQTAPTRDASSSCRPAAYRHAIRPHSSNRPSCGEKQFALATEMMTIAPVTMTIALTAAMMSLSSSGSNAHKHHHRPSPVASDARECFRCSGPCPAAAADCDDRTGCHLLDVLFVEPNGGHFMCQNLRAAPPTCTVHVAGATKREGRGNFRSPLCLRSSASRNDATVNDAAGAHAHDMVRGTVCAPWQSIRAPLRSRSRPEDQPRGGGGWPRRPLELRT